MDITTLSMTRSFGHLAADVDWLSRKVLAWKLEITPLADCCIEALEDSLVRHWRPNIFTTDQGSQFICAEFIATLRAAEVAISMDRKGTWRDNVFVERPWRRVT